MSRLLILGALCALLVPAVASAKYGSFQTPSKNIGCYYTSGGGSPTSIRCDIKSQDNPKVTAPSSCQLDYGDAYEVRKKGKGRRLCHGDTALNPSARKLAYGRSLTFQGITCTSAESGLTCKNARGHGFKLSRSAQSVF